MSLLLNYLKQRNFGKAPAFLAGICTKVYTSPGNENQWPVGSEEDEEEESISVSDRSYWSQKIQILCREAKPDVDAALALLDRLHLRGYRPDSHDLVAIVLALCQDGRFSEAHQRLLLSPSYPDHQTCNLILSELLRANTPQLTFRLLHCMTAADPTFVPSITVYNRLIHQFGSISEPNKARQLFMHLQNRGVSPNAVTYTSLIGGLCECGDLDSACRLFDEMKSEGVAPNSLTYSVLCRGHLNKRKVADAMQLMGKLWMRMQDEEGLSVNTAAFANLIDALCQNKMFQEVFKIAEEMPQGNVVREELAYSQMIDSLCRAGRNHGASRIVYIMRKRGFIPPLLSYNSIIHGLSKEDEGGCMRAYQLFEEGLAFGYSPPEPTFKVLVEGLCHVHDLGKARYLVDFMLKQENNDKTRIYNIFLGALCFMNNPSELLNLLVSMLQNGCQPDIVTLNTVIHGLCKMGRVDEAIKVFNDMLTGSFCSPDVVTYTTVISGLLDVGRIEEALNLLHQKMPESYCKPNIVTYNTVLRGLCKALKIDEAMEILTLMAGEGVNADSSTFTTIIDGLSETYRFNEAKRFWEDVIWPSGIHDDFVYAAITRGLCNAGKLSEARDFLYELVDCGIHPKIVSYNILIDKACNMGLKREAYQILKEMKENAGLEPDAVTWRTLDKLHNSIRKSIAPVKNLDNEVDEEFIDIIRVEEDKTGSILNKQGTNKLAVSKVLPELTVQQHDVPQDTENSLNEETYEEPLRGLVDSEFTEDRWKEIDGDYSDLARENTELSRSEKREPLSKLARRVFGLL
ncbi:pentatricopeptide repeat-containing protein At3g18020 [Aristolochia californica]|uniref:pentatricopeptide repeat-containing protein At3g18020 n=1 Tax=Aristolochia californica TaxID=171875 RepID=UPI0035D59B73